ncbi:MAG: response regulator, partial [Proteobacteria bacterium]|nr:response regulator [Pseudomonadota bacterium]
GLSTVYAIVKRYGGLITCRSQPEQGTTFDIFLPVSDPMAGEVETAGEVEADIRGGDETILVVDDDPSVLGVAVAILTEYGYATFAADSGERALEVFKDKADDIALVVLDLNMPGMGGRACLEELIRLDPGVKVLVASGYASDGIEKQVRETGAREYIAKPYRLTALVTKVREILDED